MLATINVNETSFLLLACSSLVAKIASQTCFSKFPARVADIKDHVKKCPHS